MVTSKDIIDMLEEHIDLLEETLKDLRVVFNNKYGLTDSVQTRIDEFDINEEKYYEELEEIKELKYQITKIKGHVKYYYRNQYHESIHNR